MASAFFVQFHVLYIYSVHCILSMLSSLILKSESPSLNYCSSDGWEKSWEFGVTPWDLGKPTPVIKHLVKSGTLPKGRALVPGCGMVNYLILLFGDSPIYYCFPLIFSQNSQKSTKIRLLLSLWHTCFGACLLFSICPSASLTASVR
jgi:hypothetical protein